MPAVGELHPQQRVPRLHEREVGGAVGLRAGVRLHVDVVAAEDLLGALDRQVLGHVDPLAAAVVAAAGVALGVLVREHRALAVEHGLGHEVLGGDHLQRALLALELVREDVGDLRIDLGEGAVEEVGRQVDGHGVKVLGSAAMGGRILVIALALLAAVPAPAWALAGGATGSGGGGGGGGFSGGGGGGFSGGCSGGGSSGGRPGGRWRRSRSSSGSSRWSWSCNSRSAGAGARASRARARPRARPATAPRRPRTSPTRRRPTTPTGRPRSSRRACASASSRSSRRGRTVMWPRRART